MCCRSADIQARPGARFRAADVLMCVACGWCRSRMLHCFSWCTTSTPLDHRFTCDARTKTRGRFTVFLHQDSKRCTWSYNRSDLHLKTLFWSIRQSFSNDDYGHNLRKTRIFLDETNTFVTARTKGTDAEKGKQNIFQHYNQVNKGHYIPPPKN